MEKTYPQEGKATDRPDEAKPFIAKIFQDCGLKERRGLECSHDAQEAATENHNLQHGGSSLVGEGEERGGKI